MNAIEQIKQLVKNLPHIIAVGGSERALIDEALNLIKNSVSASADLNHQRFVMGEHKLDHVIRAAQTIPFLASKQLIELHDAEKISAAEAKELLLYLTNPADFSVLVLIFSKIDKRNKLVSELLEKKILHLFDPIKNQDLIDFIVRESAKFNMVITRDSADLLSTLLDGDLLAIKEALNKMSLVLENSVITSDQINAHIENNATPDVFKLSRYLAEGDLKHSLYTLGLIRLKRENALKLLGVLIWQFRVLLNLRDCLDRGMSDWDIRKEVSVYGDRYIWMASLAKKRPLSFHIKRLTRLINCDRALKSHRIAEPLTLIEKVIYQNASF